MAEVLNKVSAVMNNDIMIQLNAKDDLDGEEYEDVAKAFFEENLK